MSEHSGQQRATQDIPSSFDKLQHLSKQEVRDYLLSHPDFFNEYPGLAERLSIPHDQKGSVSLVELQGEQLRTKVRQLTRKLSQLIGVAKQNEEIYRVYADLNLSLLQCRYFSDIQDTLDDVIRAKLKMSAVTLRSFGGANALPEIQRKLFIEKRFKQECFFFGRLSQHEKELLFNDRPAESVALMLLGDKGELGILAIASIDPSHFHPDMDTLLITQLQQFLNVLLPNLSGY